MRFAVISKFILCLNEIWADSFAGFLSACTEVMWRKPTKKKKLLKKREMTNMILLAFVIAISLSVLLPTSVPQDD